MTTYKFKTAEEGIDDKSRTIIKEKPVPATTQETEFTLEQKEAQLTSLKEQKASVEKQITEATAEIAEIKTALNI